MQYKYYRFKKIETKLFKLKNKHSTPILKIKITQVIPNAKYSKIRQI